MGRVRPAGLPELIAARLNAEVDGIVRSQTYREKLLPLGVQPAGGSRDELAAFQGREIPKWGRAVRASGATIE